MENTVTKEHGKNKSYKYNELETENNITKTTNTTNIDNSTCISKSWCIGRLLSLCIVISDPTFLCTAWWLSKTVYDIKNRKHRITIAPAAIIEQLIKYMF